MMNRTTLANGNVKFESFDSETLRPFVGECYELPMSGSGWVVGRFEVIRVLSLPGGKVEAEAKRVA